MAKIPLEISKFLPSKDRLIGLDMGSSSIKLAELVHQQGKLVPLKLKLQEIDHRKDNQDECVPGYQYTKCKNQRRHKLLGKLYENIHHPIYAQI